MWLKVTKGISKAHSYWNHETLSMNEKITLLKPQIISNMYAVLYCYVLIIFLFLKCCIHVYLSFYNFIRIQQNRKWSVIEQFHFHISTKTSSLYHRDLFLQAAMIYSYKLFASSGFPALIKDGRFPFLQSAYKVN